MQNPATGRAGSFGGLLLQQNSSGAGLLRMGKQTLPIFLQN